MFDYSIIQHRPHSFSILGPIDVQVGVGPEALNNTALLAACNQCRAINMSHGAWETVPDDLFDGLIQVNEIYLHHNLLTLVNPMWFYNMAKLRWDVFFGRRRFLWRARNLFSRRGNNFFRIYEAFFSGL